jgi:hypothetical protein
MNKLSTTNLNWEKHFDLYLKNYYWLFWKVIAQTQTVPVKVQT